MVASQIPVFDFSEQTLKLKEGSSEGWKSLCEGVVKACEEHGCFMVAYDRVPMHLYDGLFSALQTLFDLPEETKEKTTTSLYSDGYIGKNKKAPLYQSIAIDNVPQLDAIKAFTDLMWSQGNPDWCRAIYSMTAKMNDLHQLLIRMIFQGLGVEQHLASLLENNHATIRLNQYDPPQSPAAGSVRALQAHLDYTVLTILCENEVHGAKVLSNGGDWIQVEPSKGTFIVMVGELLEVMSNGRLQASKHTVDSAGDRVRLSFGLFNMVKRRTMVEAFDELVDEEHPLRYRPFYYEDYMQYYKDTGYINSIKVYAGI